MFSDRILLGHIFLFRLIHFFSGSYISPPICIFHLQIEYFYCGSSISIPDCSFFAETYISCFYIMQKFNCTRNFLLCKKLIQFQEFLMYSSGWVPGRGEFREVILCPNFVVIFQLHESIEALTLIYLV